MPGLRQLVKNLLCYPLTHGFPLYPTQHYEIGLTLVLQGTRNDAV